MADRAHARPDSCAQRSRVSIWLDRHRKLASRRADVNAFLVTLFEPRSTASGLRSSRWRWCAISCIGRMCEWVTIALHLARDSGSRWRLRGGGPRLQRDGSRRCSPGRRSVRRATAFWASSDVGCGGGSEAEPAASAANLAHRSGSRRVLPRPAMPTQRAYAVRYGFVCSVVGELEVLAVTSETRHAQNVPALGAAVGPSRIRAG